MTHKQFAAAVKLTDGNEAEKAVLVAFYLLKIKGVSAISLSGLCKKMSEFGLGSPNSSRLKKNSLFSKSFVKAEGVSIKLSLKKIEELESLYPQVVSESEEIISDDLVLPEILFVKTRGYLLSVAKQINASYQHNIFDGCAMLMRRLVEMLIILSYKHDKREAEILDKGGGFQALSYLINYSLSNGVLNLSKDSEGTLDEFRQLGNYSAHGLEYNCRKADIEKVRLKFRACVEELLYRSGVKK